MQSQKSRILQWIESAKLKFEDDTLCTDDFDRLSVLVESSLHARQRLLYLHSTGMHPHSIVNAATLIEPVQGDTGGELVPDPVMPYNSVHDAIFDGWRVVQFPRAMPWDDRQVNIVGYEWILEKMESYDD